MFKNILTATVITASLALLTVGDARASSRYDDHGNRWSVERNNRDDRDGRYERARQSRGLVVERKMRTRVVDETLPIRRLLDLDRSYKGYRVKSVMVKIKPGRSHGRLKLLVNGNVVDRQFVDDKKWITLRPDTDKTIGRDLKSLKLNIRGKVYIKEIKAVLVKARTYPRYSKARSQWKNRPAPVVYTHHSGYPIDRILRIILGNVSNNDRNR